MLISNCSFYTNLNDLDVYFNVKGIVSSFGGNSKEKFWIFIFFTMSLSLSILVSEIAIMSTLILVDLVKYSRSSKFMFEEQVLLSNRERQLFLFGTFIDWTSTSHYLCFKTFSRYDHIIEMRC